MSTPRFSVIESTTERLSFAEDLVLYQKAKVDGIGITERKVTNDREDLARFKASGLEAASCFLAASSILPSPLMPGPEDPAERLDVLCQSVRRLAPFEPDTCHIVSGPYGSFGQKEAHRLVLEGLRRLADETAKAGMRLALELMHPSLHDDFGYMHTIQETVDVLDEVDHPNLAIAIDLWHFGGPAPLADLEKYAPRFASLHLDDRTEAPRSWCDRVLPGDGVSDLPGILGSLDAGGFEGWYELEILSDDGSIADDFPDSLWKRDPLELVNEGRAKFLAAWEARRTGS
jgi:sugar phosphate isomerase/epimerase